MTKRFKVTITLILILIGLTFYWYVWRPHQIDAIKKEYLAEAIEKMKRSKEDDEDGMLYQSFYQSCLKEHGLEK